MDVPYDANENATPPPPNNITPPPPQPPTSLRGMNTLNDLPAGLVISCVAGSIMFFVPTYVLHTACYPWLRSRRIRYDQPHASVSIKNPPSTDEQLRREWRNAMWTSVGGLGTAVLERALVEMEFVRPLPYDDDATNNWAHIARQFLVYFLLFDCYYYFLHRFFFHGRWGWRMHRVHHDSLVCYPSTGFSFHWFEGAITGGFNPLLAHCLRFDRRRRGMPGVRRLEYDIRARRHPADADVVGPSLVEQVVPLLPVPRRAPPDGRVQLRRLHDGVRSPVRHRVSQIRRHGGPAGVSHRI